MKYESLKQIICPEDEWIYNVPLNEGREELNAILDICIDISAHQKRKPEQLRRARNLKEVIQWCKDIVEQHKSEPETRLSKLEDIWNHLIAEVKTISMVPEYDPETDRMILAPLWVT